jgi:hypothetical protein
MNTDNPMEPDNLQQAWQTQSSQTKVSIDADVLLKVVQRDQQSFRSVVQSSDYWGIGIAILMVPVWIYMGVSDSVPWTWYLTVPVLVWWAVFSIVYRMRHPLKPAPSDEPLVNCVERSLTEVDEQIWYHSKSFWWSASPIFVSVVTFAFHSAWLRSDDWLDLCSNMDAVVFFLAFFYFLYFVIEKCGCKKYEPRRQELLTLLKSLRDETASESADDSINAPSASSPASTRWSLAIAGGLFMLAILIAAGGDYLKHKSRRERERFRAERAAVEYPTKSPFNAVRWQDDEPEVRLDDEWFKLVSLNDIPATEIGAFSKRIFEDQWQQRFEEDLVELLIHMKHPPADTVTLVVQSLTTSETLVRENVPMTEKNRSTIYDANSNRSNR